MDRDKRAVVDARMEATGALFEPTGVPVVEPGHNGRMRKSRAFEAENKTRSYRDMEQVHGLLLDAVKAYKEEGVKVTTGQLLSAWALAGRDLWLAGQVAVEGTVENAASFGVPNRAANG